MFKKLKDKIAEEVKISPQRMQQIQQFTQSMTDKIQQGLEQGASSPDDGLFSISEDDSRHVDPGFTNVPLQVSTSTPEMPYRKRRNSNSSIASDVSFLPRYESSMNSYHLQSDLDVSASEVEDNVSQQSSSLGHVSKEQVHMAFQKAQMRYHKYRGRYTDLANHYRELERENAKMKGVLVETQDKAIRRVSELKEQCSLSQRAKADIEAALRIEIEEKIIIIDTLKQKVELLQSSGDLNALNGNDSSPMSSSSMTNGNGHDALLADLNEKLQECKASSIVSKEQLSTLQKELDEAKKTLLEYQEREKNNNLKFAKSKMDLHTELQNRELEITNLKQDLDTVRSDLEVYEKGGGLKAQNANLIDKCETLKARNHEMEAELLKTAQYKMEIQNLHQKTKEQEEANNITLEKLKKTHADELKAIQEDTKQSLVSLQEKMKNVLADEYQQKEMQLKEQFEIKLEQLNQDGDSLKQTQIKLMQAEDAVRRYEVSNKDDRETIDALTEKNKQLEKNYIVLMEENNGRQSEITMLSGRIKSCEEEKLLLEGKAELLAESAKSLKDEIRMSKEETSALEQELSDQIARLKTEISVLVEQETDKRKVVMTECATRLELAQSENLRLQQDIQSSNEELKRLKEETFEKSEEINHLHKVIKEDSDRVMKAHREFVEALEKVCDDQKEELASRSDTILTLTTSLDAANATIEALNATSATLRQQLEDATTKVDDLNRLQVRLADLQEEHAKLQEKVVELTQDVTKGAETEGLLKAQLAEVAEMKNTAETRWRTEKEQLILQLEDLTAKASLANEANANVVDKSLFDAKCGELKLLQCACDETNAQLKNAHDRDQQAQGDLARLTETEQALKTRIISLENRLSDVEIDNDKLQTSEGQVGTLQLEVHSLQARNEQLSTDNKRLMDDNDKLLAESSDIMLQLATKITNTDAEVSAKLADVTMKYSMALTDARTAEEALERLKKETSAMDSSKAQYEQHTSALEKHVADLERHVIELEQERQFLKDEVAELKTTPMNITTTSGAASVTQKDVETLQAKLAQYKNIDQTNRSSIEFYEHELQKLQLKNEKLNRKLDETLVTLSHCADLSASTEVEYLKNVLYNYMLGKESVMMAKVIAAVCKFDRQQTEAVLKHEQHKQTLLGQLGIL